MVQGEDHRMDRPQGLPRFAFRVFKLNKPIVPGKADGRPQPGFFFRPGNTGVFLLLLFAGFAGLHDQGVPVHLPGDADETVGPDEQAQAPSKVVVNENNAAAVAERNAQNNELANYSIL